MQRINDNLSHLISGNLNISRSQKDLNGFFTQSILQQQSHKF